MMWVERSSKVSADNYRVEILGGVGAQLLVKAAVTGRHVAGSHIPKYGCNNMGVVIHRTHCNWQILEKQERADALRLFKSLLLTSCIWRSNVPCLRTHGWAAPRQPTVSGTDGEVPSGQTCIRGTCMRGVSSKVHHKTVSFWEHQSSGEGGHGHRIAKKCTNPTLGGQSSKNTIWPTKYSAEDRLQTGLLGRHG